MTIAAVSIFTIYLAVSLITFRTIPPSLSATYYLWEEKKKGLGFLFMGAMAATAFLLLPVMIELGEGSNWGFLGFFAPVGLLFVAAAPRFKSSEYTVHATAAVICGIAAILWCILTVHLWWVIPSVLLADIIWFFCAQGRQNSPTGAFFSETMTFWIEMEAFYSTFVALIILFFR